MPLFDIVDQVEESDQEELSSDDDDYPQQPSLDKATSFQWTHSKIDEYVLRQRSRDFLHIYMKSRENVLTIESLLYKLSIVKTKLNRQLYVNSIREFHSMIYTHHPKDILTLIREKKTGYNSSEYSIFTKMEEDEIDKLNTKMEAIEGLYTCNKCKQSKTSQYALQLRSSDEPMNVFISCLNPECRNKWREG